MVRPIGMARGVKWVYGGCAMVQCAERPGSGHCIEDPAQDEGKEKKEDRRNRSVEHRQSPLWLRGVVWHKVGRSSGHYWQCFMCNGPHCA